MNHPENLTLINTFYTAFQERDAEKMASCYHMNITFHDPAFQNLAGVHAGNMWRMLLVQADKNMKIRYGEVWANETEGGAKWEADYVFSKTGRLVNNKITAHFKFKDGKIIEHKDCFNLWKWSGMALGPIGYVLGFSSLLKNKIRAQAKSGLKKFEDKLN